MGSLETGISLKRDNVFRSSSAGRTERHPFSQRPRSRFSRFFLFKKLDYLQWICTMAVFLFFVVFFQMFLPGSVVEKSGASFDEDMGRGYGDLNVLKEMGVFEFGDDVRFEPTKLLEKFHREARETSLYSSAFNRTLQRYGYRKPQLALVSVKLLSGIFMGSYILMNYDITFLLVYHFALLMSACKLAFLLSCDYRFDFIFYLKVFADLLVDSQKLLMVTVAAALKEIGYEIQVVYFASSFGG